MAGDSLRQPRLATMIETAESHYDFATPAYLNAAFPDIQPITFRDWFISKLNTLVIQSRRVPTLTQGQVTGRRCRNGPKSYVSPDIRAPRIRTGGFGLVPTTGRMRSHRRLSLSGYGYFPCEVRVGMGVRLKGGGAWVEG
jgi:hypothetical protein